MRKRLYLSGPITGVNDYFERFQRAFLALEEAGYQNVIVLTEELQQALAGA